MPTVEAPFITAVIREKEKTMLGENEVTRIMHAQTMHDMREVLMTTPYATHLANDVSISDAVTNYLEQEFAWLADSLDNDMVLAFLGTRYDALHVAQGILALSAGESAMPSIPELGILSHAQLQEMIFDSVFIEKAPASSWARIIQEQQQAIAQGTWSSPQLFAAMQQELEVQLEHFAQSPFMHELAALAKAHHEADHAMRNATLPESAAAYERTWDESALALAKQFQYEPVGYDPIVAYWITKEYEAKNIRLLVAAIQGGFSQQEAGALIRNLH
ncbi:MAG: hypothetical protein A3E36_01380 [Candidatus Andersenbacteria bacterium RIFCSPHIGHO2_12_FULL_45_11b]|uniref:V-type ATP synthase subunit C n=1 Tax=Candidatus Andersenbacteria bacterium RIFCSPHIGHO2_12_FULL_45_11b TaxID=1797282 RepID=A0A1G1XCB5_9BACT|nr:MAG: hypothetical protein A3E36_01380 [Candidatus Andersenbacteria bacterium RIFCSPHIGHO2_12_FULL_45_11b]